MSEVLKRETLLRAAHEVVRAAVAYPERHWRITVSKAAVCIDMACAALDARTYSVSDMKSRLDLSQPAASRLVTRLIEVGLVVRTESVQDGRSSVLSLTPKGVAYVDYILDAMRKKLTREAASIA